MASAFLGSVRERIHLTPRFRHRSFSPFCHCFSALRYCQPAAVVGVNTSPDFVNVTGTLSVIDLESQTIAYEIELPGQPDAVDVSKDTSSFPIYIAVAIENERDEDLGDGAPPQLPAGLLTIVTISSEEEMADPTAWMSMDIDKFPWISMEFHGSQ